MKRNRFNQILSVVVSAHLVLSLIPLEALAEANRIGASDVDVQEEALPNAVFDQALTMEDIEVSVKAGEGAFPTDATLKADLLAGEREDAAVAAVALAREGEEEHVSSHALDVWVCDANGNELQPKEGQKVTVALGLAEAKDEKLQALVYGIAEESQEEEIPNEEAIQEATVNSQNDVTDVSHATATLVETTEDAEAGTVTFEVDELGPFVVVFVPREDPLAVSQGGNAPPEEGSEHAEDAAPAGSSTNGQNGPEVNEGVTEVPAPDAGTANQDKPSAQTDTSTEAEPSTKTEIVAQSATENIVGEVFANAANEALEQQTGLGEATSDPERHDQENYPTESHDESYYDGSDRLRKLTTADGTDAGFLVYRDTLFLVSREDSANYNVTWSEDGLTAYVMPAIDPTLLEGKMGIVLLQENVGTDVVLVFAEGQAPTLEGDTLVVPLEATQNISLYQLFSDGSLSMSAEYSGPSSLGPGDFVIADDEPHGSVNALGIQNTLVPQSAPVARKGLRSQATLAAPALRASGSAKPILHPFPKGTNWEATIAYDSVSIDHVGARVDIDIWDLKFDLVAEMAMGFDFDVKSTGASGKRESVEVIGVDIPIELFTLHYAALFEAEFDSTPVHIAGRMNPSMEFHMNPLFGFSIQNFKTPITLKTFELTNPERDKNKDFNCYLGTGFTINQSFLGLSLDLGFWDIEIGPLVSLNQLSQGGTYYTARLDKDQYDVDTFDRTPDSVHACAGKNDPGCYCIHTKGSSDYDYNVKLDLYFKSWTWSIRNKHNDLAEADYYNSLTFNTGLKEGICPYIMYKVPVTVWQDEAHTKPAANMRVMVNDNVAGLTGDPYKLTTDTTDSNGQATIYLPYRARYYTYLANGNLNGQFVIGSTEGHVERRANDTVHIVVGPKNTTTVRVAFNWNADTKGLDMPMEESIVVQRRLGGAGAWEDCYPYQVSAAQGWEFSSEEEMYGTVNGNTMLYEYRVRATMNGYVVAEDSELGPYTQLGTASYVNAAGETEPPHLNNYYTEYEDKNQNGSYTTTITQTPVVDVALHKQWMLSSGSKQPDSVYLALTQSPEDGWDYVAAAQNVSLNWLLVRNPLSNNANSLNQLRAAGAVSSADSLLTVGDIPLTVAKVDASNSWSTTFRVPKYRNGVKMRFQAIDLSDTVLNSFLIHEYDLQAKVSVANPNTFTCIPGIAFRNRADYELDANVVNHDNRLNTIGGTVRWVPYGENTGSIPQSVKVHVTHNGTDVSVLTLNKASYANPTEWTWTLSNADINPENDYQVWEEFTGTDGNRWITETHGLDILNSAYGSDRSVIVDVRAGFDDEVAQPSELNVSFKNSNGATLGNPLRLAPQDWSNHTFLDRPVQDASAYHIEAPALPNTVRLYRDPVVYVSGENLTYNYTVYYTSRKKMEIDISSIWENVDASTVYPDKLTVHVFRDGEEIATTQITKGQDGQWSTPRITKDDQGHDLYRVSESGHEYLYTVTQDPVPGFTTTVLRAQVSEQSSDPKMGFVVRNTWVGSDYQTVKGTVSWVGDEGMESLRPQNAHLSVVNGDGEYVRSLDVPTSGDGKFEATYLPGKNAQKETATYEVLQDHVDYYTTTYENTYDEQTRTWTCNVTNKLTGAFNLNLKKKIAGVHEGDAETYRFTVEKAQPNRANDDNPQSQEVSIKGEGTVQVPLKFKSDGLYFYVVKEIKGNDDSCKYDTAKRLVLIVKTTDDEGNPTFKCYVGDYNEKTQQEADKALDPSSTTNPNVSSDGNQAALLEALNGDQTNTVEFTNKYRGLSIEKKWDIDLEDKDKPAKVEVVLQKQDGGTWTTVQTVELNDSNDWKKNLRYPDGTDENTTFRVRELKDQTVLQSIVDKVKDLAGQGDAAYRNWLNELKSNGFYASLPSNVQSAAEEGMASLQSSLGASSLEDLASKLMEQLGFNTDTSRIVYDSKDSDKGESTTNEVIHHVEAYVSVLTGNERAHNTKYQVSYDSEKDDDTQSFSITNKAIVEIDVIKRWIGIGVDEKDMPDSAWLVLMCKPKEGALDAAKGLASAAGIDLGGVLDYEFPVINPIEGGQDPITILGKMALGLDLSLIGKLAKALFGIKIPELAMKRVTKEDNWRFTVVDSKYTAGIPMDYKGAELTSEIIRLIVKYLTNGFIDSPVSFNPFGGYISIPTKAIPTVLGITDIEQLTDLKDLEQRVINKAKELTPNDFANPSWSTILTDYHLMSNVFNIKVDWDIPDNPTGYPTGSVYGKKTWDDQDNKFGKRPQTVKIYLLANGQRVKDDDGNDVYAETSQLGNWRYSFVGRPTTDDNGNPITYSVEEEPVAGYSTSYNGYDITNKLETVDLTFTKYWDDGDNRDGVRPDSVEVNLLADGKVVDTHTVTANEGWTWNIGTYLKYGDDGQEIAYTAEEVSAPEQYTALPYAGQTSTKLGIVNRHEVGTTTLTLSKHWDDANNQDGKRPQSLDLNLQGSDGSVRTYTIGTDQDWQKTVVVPRYENGQEIKYTLVEPSVPVGYTKTESKEGTHLTVTNTHTPETLNISVTKVWNDDNNRDALRPEAVTVQLLANGDVAETKSIGASDSWQHTFAGVPKYRNGKQITYTVSESAVSGYRTKITGSAATGFTITNTHSPQQIRINSLKHWNDDNNRDGLRPPQITMQLKGNGEVVREFQISTNSDKRPISLAPKYDAGKEVTYSVDEKTVPTGYTKSIDSSGLRITNTHVPQRITISGKKVWDDDNDRDGKRPDSVTVHLLANGVEVAHTTATAEGGWTWSFESRYKNEQGKAIAYTVTEDAVDGYTATVTGTAEAGFTITNTHVPETVSLTLTKHWEDANDQDGVRPDQVALQLMANGTAVKTFNVIDTQHDWESTYVLPKYENGTEISYALVEPNVPSGYTKTESKEGNNLTVTNTHVPETLDAGVAKVWVDSNNQDGKRPASVTVRLLANGQPVQGKTLTLNEGDSWKGTFTGLDKNAAGKQIAYTVAEDAVDLYTTAVSGNTTEGFTITNSYTPQKTQVSVYKVWDDEDDRERVRPISVTVRLLANGQPVQGKTLTLNEGNSWTGTFTDLDKNAGGKEIAYTVAEDAVEGYTTQTQTGAEFWKPIVGDSEEVAKAFRDTFFVTNTHETTDVHITGIKTWNDGNDRDGVRPHSVKVWLLSNNTPIAWQVVSAGEDGAWTYDFGEFPKYRDGNEVTYSVREDTLDGTGETFSNNPIEGYTTTYAPLSAQGNDYVLDIANTHVWETTDVELYKVWDDRNDAEGVRPQSLTVYLCANGVRTGRQQVLSAQNSWTCRFTNLPKNEAGTTIAYTVEEEQPIGYTLTNTLRYVLESNNPTDDPRTLIALTNTHKTSYVNISGTKTWDDAENNDGMRPDSVKVWLLSDGLPIAWQLVVPDENGAWTYDFGEFPAWRDGKEVTYTVREDVPEGSGDSFVDNPIEGYTTTYAEPVQRGDDYILDITNTHEPARVAFSAAKRWDDSNDRDGIRPQGVTVHLWADGEMVQSRTLTAKNGWQAKFDTVLKLKQGSEIDYTLTEDAIDGYATAIELTELSNVSKRFDVTNTHEPETVRVHGTKVWDDDNDRDGIRPNSIDVILYRNGEEVERTTVSETDNWAWQFSEQYKKKNGQDYVYTIAEEPVEGYTPSISGDVANGFVITNKHKPETITVRGTKVWSDNNDQDGKRPDSITVKLMDGSDVVQTRRVNAASGWRWEFTNVPKNNGRQEIAYTVVEDPVEDYAAPVISGNMQDGFTITNTHVPEVVTISGSKTWVDANDQDGKRPESVTVRLLANDSEVRTATVGQGQNWTWSFDDLPKYRDGKEISYRIVEDAVEGYTTKVDGYNVTNTHVPETMTVTVTKMWDDAYNQDGKRPRSVTVRLLANGTEVQSANITIGKNWRHSWSGLPKYANGQEIAYTLTEDAVAEYTTKVDGTAETGFVVTNTHAPLTAPISGTKTWDDANNQDGKRPARITVHLRANGEVVDTKTVTANDGWAWNFGAQPVFRNGERIVYTVSEDPIEDYTTTINGYNITNTRTPDKTQVHVFKLWDDWSNAEGKRPSSATVHLQANGADTGKELVLNEGNGWCGTFDLLDKNKDGREINYTVTEDEVADYTTKIERGEGELKNVFMVTNTHETPDVDISVQKVWDDGDDRDGLRPESVRLWLLSDGLPISYKDVTAADGWSWTFEEFPEYRGGKKVVYTVAEDPVDGYTTSVSGNVQDGFTITNTHYPETTQVTVYKLWSDRENEDGSRPLSLSVALYANGTFTGRTLQLAATQGSGDSAAWQGTITGLYKNAGGKPVAYAVQEQPVTGYEEIMHQSYEDETGTYCILMNYHEPAGVDIAGKKVWDDDNDRDGVRPQSVRVWLVANGTRIGWKDVTADDNWEWKFEDFPKKLGGETAVYTVEEDAVDGYTTQITGNVTDGFVITNTHEPELADLHVYKVWDDWGNEEGLRPASVTVHLQANGADTGKSLTLSEDNAWHGSLEDCKKYEAGEPIAYTVTEDVVPEYETTVQTVENEDTTFYFVWNAHEGPRVTISGTKTWDDAGEQNVEHPESILVWLHSDGMRIAYQEVSAANNWKWSFEDFPVYRNGKKVAYTVSEDAVPQFTPDYSGYDITNTYTPGKTYVEVHKVWEDQDDWEGIRPASVTVHLLANGEDTGRTLELSAQDDWRGIFTGLDVAKDGEPIDYTVTEDEVDGYACEVQGDMRSGFTLVNTHGEDHVTIRGTKIWDDDNDRDGVRPEAIEVVLYADGKEEASRTVTAADNWTWQFEGMLKSNRGKPIAYTVGERPVEGYETTITGSLEEGFRITNTHVPATTEATVRKVWDDEENLDGSRPSELAATLSDGTRVTLSEGNGWTATVRDLPKYADGKEVAYAWAEEEVPAGYELAGTATEGTVTTLTNRHVPLRHVITYDLNGGTYQGSAENIKETHLHGEQISIHEKPERAGYEFDYWKGSSYQPGDAYTVLEDHTFVAQWRKAPTPTPVPPDEPSDDPTVPDKPIDPSNPASPADHMGTQPLARTADGSLAPEAQLRMALCGLVLIGFAWRRRRPSSRATTR